MAFFNAKKHGLNPQHKPSMRDVNKFVTANYAQYWKLIGQNLQVPNLDNIVMDHHTHPRRNQECFRAMITIWLQIDTTATWEKLQKAINGAIKAEYGTPETGPNSGTEGRDKPETGSQAVPGPSEGSSIQIKTEGYDTSRPKEVKRKHDEDEDNARPTGSVSVNPARISTGRGTQETGMEYAAGAKRPKLEPDDESDGADQVGTGNQADFLPKHPSGYDDKDIEMKPNQGDGVPSKSSDSASTEPSTSAASDAGAEMTEYSKIQKKLPAYAVIINNQKFSKEDDREGTEKDVDKLLELERLNISFKHVLTDVTAEEIIGALKFLATRNPEDIRTKENGKGALKLFDFSEEYIKTYKSVEHMQGTLMARDLPKFDDFSCLMVFLLTHGSKDDELVCLNSTTTTVEELSEIFNSENCQDLKGMPKIFFIQACRGENQMKADLHNDKGDKKGDKTKSLPKEADFLFAYATPKGYLAMRDPASGSPFIQTLVNVLLNTRQHNHHLEEALLSVKHQVANKDVWYGAKKVKMMPSVVSQMRGKIEFDLTAA